MSQEERRPLWRPANTADRRAESRAAWVPLPFNGVVGLSPRALRHTLRDSLRFRGARSVELRKCGSLASRGGAKMQKSQEVQKSVAMVQLHMCGCGHLLSKQRTHLGRTAEVGGTGEQADLLGSDERAAHAAVTAADRRHWELQVVHAWTWP